MVAPSSPDPLPHLDAACQSGAGQQSALVELPGVEAEGQTKYRPRAFSYRASRSRSGGQPAQATPVARPLQAGTQLATVEEAGRIFDASRCSS